MANERYSFDAQFSAVMHEGRRVSYREFRRANRQIVLAADVPSGKNILLNFEAVVASTDPQFLFVESDTEGVQWWPINAPASLFILPGVDPDTQRFGWLLDLDQHVYSHAHGAVASQNVVAHAAGDAFYDTLPAWQAFQVDQVTPGVATGRVLERFPTDQRINFNGKVVDLSVDNAAHASVFANYMLGVESPLKLGMSGTSNDGLELMLVAYVSDPTKVEKLSVFLYCYPFTANQVDPTLLPTSTPQGPAPWATNDPMLCRNAQVAGPTTIGWDPGNVNQGGWIELGVDPAVLAAGWKQYRLSKLAVAGVCTVGTQATNAYLATFQGGILAGSATTRRVTQVVLRNKAVAGQTPQVYVANLWFGPRPGALRTLRPFSYVTDRPWSNTNYAAIGLQNHTGRNARVRAFYGTLGNL